MVFIFVTSKKIKYYEKNCFNMSVFDDIRSVLTRCNHFNKR